MEGLISMNTKFTLDETPYYEAILFPNGDRAFFLVHSGHGMHSDVMRLAKEVVSLLNEHVTPARQLEVCPYSLPVDPRNLTR